MDKVDSDEEELDADVGMEGHMQLQLMFIL
jgi:hypothetical protein